MFDFWYFELVPPSVCSGALPLLCPSCPLSRESSHVVAVLTGWSLTCHLLISSDTRCRCSTPAPVMVYIALTQAQVLECFAPASSAYAGRFCEQQQGASFSPCRAHRLHLHLWWSTSRRHKQFVLHLRLSWCTSRSSEIDSFCCQLKQILSCKKLGKGHASEIFANSVSLPVDSDAWILFRSTSAIRVNWLLPPHSEIKRAIAFWLSLLPRGPFRAVPPHSGTPFVFTMSTVKIQAVLQPQSGALWHLMACTNPVGFKSTLHLLYSKPGLKVQILSPSVTSTRLRPSFLLFVFAPGPTSSAVRFGCTSSTMTVLWLVLSLVAPKTTH